ncbi:glycosyltransferase [Aureitalea marina]|uniref:Glycosyltransferase n=1 Tax=Aureitalea marina TaxID=930804 RepID=A0A2S7KQA5_9FLAO|nr:glycosyltransferase [Aureitalea marina]PQB04768.1 hypothetical protein BST85_07570 [Aureitalea marina]
MKGRRVLIIGHTYPESRTTGAGRRMLQLIQTLDRAGADWHLASTAQKTAYTDPLPEERLHEILLNDSSFDSWISELAPQVVIFDRFMTEEQFGWRVTQNCPLALRVLDTEDLHFLRKARQKEQEGLTLNEALYSDTAKRELAAILRSDISLIISEFEMKLLQQQFNVDVGQLLYLPLWSEGQRLNLPSFEKRQHFVTIGNLLHPPNADAIGYLAIEIWPQIRRLMPDARLDVYGAYDNGKFTEYHQPDNGFHLKGWMDNLSAVMPQYRINLCGVRFGAGLKVKLLDAMEYGIPSISTSVGAEGIGDAKNFPGRIADIPSDFAQAAHDLYSRKPSWEQAADQAKRLLEDRFDADHYRELFIATLEKTEAEIASHRKKHFIIDILQHQSLQSTRYMSKWIEEKNRESKD